MGRSTSLSHSPHGPSGYGKTSFAPEETVLIGDRLYTDIACGANAGVNTIFVLSGEGTMEDLDIQEFYALCGMDKINDALLYAKELKDRYSVLWVNYDFAEL